MCIRDRLIAVLYCYCCLLYSYCGTTYSYHASAAHPRVSIHPLRCFCPLLVRPLCSSLGFWQPNPSFKMAEPCKIYVLTYRYYVLLVQQAILRSSSFIALTYSSSTTYTFVLLQTACTSQKFTAIASYPWDVSEDLSNGLSSRCA